MNWDALNGDPSYGADEAARWWRHYRTNIWDWVHDGGILVIEGQANRSIPVQEAYDAILGEHEVLVSGMEDPLHALKQEREDVRRVGRACRLTRSARDTGLFRDDQGMPQEYRPVDRSFADYFPDTRCDPPLPAGLKHPEPTRLWRGWFRTWSFRRTHFAWTPLLESAEWGRLSHPTLLVAAHGKGAIFASTMHLALGNRNPYLLAAFLRARLDHNLLPKPAWRIAQRIDRPLAATLAAAVLFLVWQRAGGEVPDWLKTLGGGALLLLLPVVVGLRRWLRRVAATVMRV